jgi:hypothetical protein
VKTVLFQLDGKLPNLALMRLAANRLGKGHAVELLTPRTPDDIQPLLFGGEGPVEVFGSAIFEKSLPKVERLRASFPSAVIGGTGVDRTSHLSEVGVLDTDPPDYSLWPEFTNSIGFSQRGCRMKCPFCVVPEKEGRVQEVSTIADIWRGDPHPKNILLLDNDFFGQPHWRERIAEIREGDFAVSFVQGINVRVINAEVAAAVASVNYRDGNFRTRRIYCAWDNKKDERVFFRGIHRLLDAGIRPGHIMVYMLIGYWPGETHEDRDYRRAKLRELGVDPYPMPFTRTKELVGFQRWVVRAIDKKLPWDEFVAAGFDARNIGGDYGQSDLFGLGDGLLTQQESLDLYYLKKVEEAAE